MGLLSTIGAASGRAFGFTRSAIAAATDAFFNRVTLLLPGNGTNGAQNNTFLDSSTNNFTITRNGNTTQGTFSPFSQTGWSVQFDRADYNNLLIPSSSDFDFSSGNFTIECWINPQALPAAGDGSFHWIFATSNLVAFFFSGNIYFRNQATTELVTPVAHGMSSGVWYHLAFVRSGSNYAIYRNGSSISTGSGSTVASGASALTIAGSSGFNGITACTLSNFRITNGQALYTGAFTPSTSPLTTTSQGATASNVKLLTCQSNRFVDNSTQNTKTIQFGSGTTIGNRTIQPFSPFAPTAAYSAATVGGSGYFDGSGDSLVTPSITIGTNAFCFECWVYPTATQGSLGPGIFVSTSANGLQCAYFGSGNLGIAQKAVAWQVTSSTGGPIVGQWNHVAFVRSGTGTNQTSIFLNGVRIANGTVSTSYGASAYSISILDTDFTPFVGYVSSARFTNGASHYNASSTTITIPTAPLTTTSQSATNTVLLLNMTNAGITDATAKNALETVGNAQISTTRSKWGGSSIFLDGTGDCLAIPAPQKELFRFGTGDFTIEFWAWKSADGAQSYDSVISISPDGTFNGGFGVELSASRGFLFLSDSAARISSSLNPNDSTWRHYAVVRSGNNLALYRDGVRLTTNAFSGTLGINGNAFIGACSNSTATNFNGYINDLRVTRGYARYSGASFTVPSAPFETL